MQMRHTLFPLSFKHMWIDVRLSAPYGGQPPRPIGMGYAADTN